LRWSRHRAGRNLVGLVFETLGRRPQAGDEIELDAVRVAVEAVEGARITRLLDELGR
jgi:CBS domain containing-hemolysin-like protein